VAFCFTGAYLSADSRWYGAVIGYSVGFLNTFWLYRDVRHIADLDLSKALRRMRRSLAFRLGLITVVVGMVARWQGQWLLHLAVGIAVGVLLSLVLSIIYLARNLSDGNERRDARRCKTR